MKKGRVSRNAVSEWKATLRERPGKVSMGHSALFGAYMEAFARATMDDPHAVAPAARDLVRVGLLHASSRSRAGWWRARVCVVAAKTALKIGQVEVALEEADDGVENGCADQAEDGVAEADSDPDGDEGETEYCRKVLSGHHWSSLRRIR